MEQALWENNLRNLLWLLRLAAPYSPLALGLDDAVTRIPSKEQSTATTPRKPINCGASAGAER
jgi:hypothetical protein